MGRPRRTSEALSIRDVGGYEVRIADTLEDAAWDDFLEQVPGGLYAQASCWGRARASIGWHPARLVISEAGRVVAGVQMEMRALPVGGKIGLVRKGPILGEDSPDLARLVVDEMMAMGKSRGVRYLVVEPPRGSDRVVEELARVGFRHAEFNILDTQQAARVIVDLWPDLDQMLAAMHPKRRQQIRSAGRRGVTVRRGSHADLPVFDRLKDAHSSRLGYTRRERAYYAELWQALAPRRHVELFIAEHGGEPISAELVIPFGDTCHLLEVAWGGEHPELRPNEILEWEIYKWAKFAGYRYADLGGLETHVAEAVLSGRKDSIDPRYGASLFKLSFGGQVVVAPAFVDYVYNPILRLAYRCMPERVLRSEWTNKMVSRYNRTGS
jgi:peptidoglycan pentaglycine glycine transferase (the first glycine)